ncbi:MAG: type IV secretory system conjugative DNA transfer family protein [Sphingomonadaceae bacterium]
MRPAHRRRLNATAVSLSLLMAVATMPVAAQETSPADFDRDRAVMADLLLKRSEIQYRQSAGEIDATEAQAALAAEVAPTLGALQARWRPTGRLMDMEMQAMSLRHDEYQALQARYGAEARASGLGEAWAAVLTTFSHIWPYLIAVPLALVALIGVLRVLAAGQKPRNPPPVSDNFGTARYAAVRTEMPHWSYAHQGVFFGKSSDPDMKAVPLAEQPGAPILSTPEHHTLIVARTRTGKGTRVIVPTLLRYAGSAIVIDPKGENAAVTARVRAGMICDAVHIINPWGELAATFAARDLPAATFNPLDVLVRDDPNAVAVAQALAGAICPSSPNDKDRYWQGSAANVLAAVLLWITDQPGESKTLARAREIVSMSRKDFTDSFLVKMAASSAFGGAIKEMVSPYLDLAQETYLCRLSCRLQ